MSDDPMLAQLRLQWHSGEDAKRQNMYAAFAVHRRRLRRIIGKDIGCVVLLCACSAGLSHLAWRDQDPLLATGAVAITASIPVALAGLLRSIGFFAKDEHEGPSATLLRLQRQTLLRRKAAEGGGWASGILVIAALALPIAAKLNTTSMDRFWPLSALWIATALVVDLYRRRALKLIDSELARCEELLETYGASEI